MSESKQLTGRQRAFVEHYCGDASWDATKAAELAGYSKNCLRQTASENLSKPNIQAAIQKRQIELSKRADICAEDVIRELKAIGFSDLTEYLDEDSLVRGKIKLSDWRKLTKAQRAAVAEISEIPGRKGKEGGYLRFKQHNKLDALDKLCRYLGLFERDNEQKGARTVIIFQDSRGKKIVSNEAKEQEF